MLSRTLKVQSNAAKKLLFHPSLTPELTFLRMLYEFHRLQNSQKTGSIHATYLLMGTAAVGSAQPTDGVTDGNQDTAMQCDPDRSSPVRSQDYAEEIAKQRLVTLVGEEHLESKTASRLRRARDRR